MSLLARNELRVQPMLHVRGADRAQPGQHVCKLHTVARTYRDLVPGRKHLACRPSAPNSGTTRVARHPTAPRCQCRRHNACRLTSLRASPRIFPYTSALNASGALYLGSTRTAPSYSRGTPKYSAENGALGAARLARTTQSRGWPAVLILSAGLGLCRGGLPCHAGCGEQAVPWGAI